MLRWLPIILLVLGGVAIWAAGLGQYASLSELVRSREALIEYVDRQPILTALAYAGIYALVVIFSVPGGSLLTMVGGVLFGGLVGGMITILAATAGSLGVFLLARTSLGDWLRHRALAMGPRAGRFANAFRRNAFYVILLLRLVPILPYWASNVVPALFGVGLRVFVLATLIGLLPWAVSFAFFGEALDALIADQTIANPGCAEAGTCELDLSALGSGPLAIGLGIAVLALLPVAAHWWTQRGNGNGQETKADV